MSETGNGGAPVGGPDFNEIRKLIGEMPSPDVAAVAATRAREGELAKPPGALGRLEEITEWVAAWQGRHPPNVTHARVAVFAGNHGVAALGVSAFPAEVTGQMVQNFVAGGAAVNQLTELADADLRVYELALETPTDDFTQGPALSEADCAKAVAYGMMSVEAGVELIALGEMGIANTTAAAAICHALYGSNAQDWVGPGTGVAGDALAAKVAAVEAGIAVNRELLGDPLHVLRALGGHEIAAMAGAIIAARLAGVPVLLDGFTSTAAAAVLHAIDEHAIDHCMVGHLSAEPAHRALCEKLNKVPLLALAMRLGEGSGAALAIQIVRAALACHNGMATFADAAVSSRAN
ncbi:MAG: nicotinate-nucleotide--dimethylbenzimidazole phosphoribosyltransferase [Rhodospirillaceae bacterium]|nr:nicotinate-nucleotide--dimethylbenzimidazole phosphoribosyltransferase [Rhodospirillaceae bacterium]